MYYIPDDIMGIINDFLGRNYWYNRSKLTLVSKALDFMTCDYTINSYWLWKEWRNTHVNCGVRINKPLLPLRIKIRELEMNPYIVSISPPKMNVYYTYIKRYHKHLSKIVYFP